MRDDRRYRLDLARKERRQRQPRIARTVAGLAAGEQSGDAESGGGYGAADGGSDPRKFITTGEDALREPVRFALEAGGVLRLTGTFDQGAAQRFADEIAARGEYVRTVSLDSPGGSLDDAMEIARLIRKGGFATEVADGAICASSCPLAFAGGTQRRVGSRAAIGLHLLWRYKTKVWTQPWRGWDDVDAVRGRCETAREQSSTLK